jgi:hypothetical protein
VGAAASLGFLGEVSQLFFTGLPNPEKMGSRGSVVGEGRGCRRLIEAEAGARGAGLSAWSVSIERGGETTQMPAQK